MRRKKHGTTQGKTEEIHWISYQGAQRTSGKKPPKNWDEHKKT